jgi:hypothetical protein
VSKLLRISVSVAALVIGAAFPVTTVAAAPSSGGSGSSAVKACYNIRGSVKVPEAPLGFANIVTTTLTNDCRLVVSKAQLVPDPRSAAVTANTMSSSLTAGAPPALAGVSAAKRQSPGDPTATSYYRLWDNSITNIELNGTATSMTWSYSGGRVTSASGKLYEYWANDGWVLMNDRINWYTGCTGCTTLGLHGWADFCFLPSSCGYENTDDNYITGTGNGGYQNCYSSWWWKAGFPGWHTQVWCGWGYTGI